MQQRKAMQKPVGTMLTLKEADKWPIGVSPSIDFFSVFNLALLIYSECLSPYI